VAVQVVGLVRTSRRDAQRLDTLSHTWDPAFQPPALPLGPTHTNYHAFREFTLSVGAMLILAYGMFLPLAKRSRDLWKVMCVTAFCYYGGWWIPSPLFGLHAPNTPATVEGDLF
jgi:hypothetical protein